MRALNNFPTIRRDPGELGGGRLFERGLTKILRFGKY